jgi:predicted ATPase
LVDNFEHVAEVSPLLSELLSALPDLKVLVTSRSRLRLYGEHDYPVPPLDLPDLEKSSESDELVRVDALSLFAARARAVSRGFQITDANARDLAELCVRLDGLPLAIELAAARAGELSPQQMLGELPLNLTGIGPRDVDARHQTLRNTIEWSYGLLGPVEQGLFRRLAVFAGGCTPEAARVVCDAGVAVLEDLVRTSLVRRTADGTGGSRLSMLDTIRAFAADALDDSGDGEVVRRRHAEHFLGLVEGLQPLREARLAIVEAELDNVRAALAFAAQAGLSGVGLRLCAVLWRFWYVRGLLSEGAAHIETALRCDTGDLPGPRAGTLRAASVIAWAEADHDRATDFAQRSLEIYGELGDETGMTRALISLGIARQSRGDLAEARAAHEQSRQLAARLGLHVELVAALANLGDVAMLEQDHERARRFYQESLVLSRDSKDVEGSAIALMCLGLVSLWHDGDQHAAGLFAESLRLFARLRFTDRMAACLTGLAASIVDDDAGRAGRLLGAAEALRQGTTSQMEAWWERPLVETTSRAARGHLGEESFAAILARGRAAPEESLQEALELQPGGSPS